MLPMLSIRLSCRSVPKPVGRWPAVTRPVIFGQCRLASTVEKVRFNPTTIVVQDPHAATQDDILEKIKPISPAQNESELTRGAIFLLTSSLSHWLQDDAFLTKAVQRLHSNIESKYTDGKTLTVVVGVVDRVSARKIPIQDDTQSPIHLGAKDFEGLVYVSTSGNAFTSLGLGENQSGQNLEPSVRKSISIQLYKRMLEGLANPMTKDTMGYELQIPLANTIFQTGREYTLFSTTWTKNGDSESLYLSSKQEFNSLRITPDWPFQRTERIRAEYSLATPLIPLTVPRQIAAGMGNIVRQLYLDNQSKTTIPTSKELEEAVHNYFSATGIPPYSMPVWALVLPQKYYRKYFFKYGNSYFLKSMDAASQDSQEILKKQWTNGPIIWRNRFLLYFMQGAKLRRVLSGGGGWGKKAGLLSLDPETWFGQSTEISAQSEFEAEFFARFGSEDTSDTSDTSDTKSYPEIAKMGDYIQFFTTKPEFIDQSNGTEAPVIPTPQPEIIGTLEIGSMPSMVDAMPNVLTTQTPNSSSSSIQAYRTHFGVASASGIGLSLQSYKPKDSTTELIVQMKIDVPYTQFSLANYYARHPSFRKFDVDARDGSEIDKFSKGAPPSSTRFRNISHQLIVRRLRTRINLSEASVEYYTKRSDKFIKILAYELGRLLDLRDRRETRYRMLNQGVLTGEPEPSPLKDDGYENPHSWASPGNIHSGPQTTGTYRSSPPQHTNVKTKMSKLIDRIFIIISRRIVRIHREMFRLDREFKHIIQDKTIVRKQPTKNFFRKTLSSRESISGMRTQLSTKQNTFRKTISSKESISAISAQISKYWMDIRILDVEFKSILSPDQFNSWQESQSKKKWQQYVNRRQRSIEKQFSSNKPSYRVYWFGERSGSGRGSRSDRKVASTQEGLNKRKMTSKHIVGRRLFIRRLPSKRSTLIRNVTAGSALEKERDYLYAKMTNRLWNKLSIERSRVRKEASRKFQDKPNEQRPNAVNRRGRDRRSAREERYANKLIDNVEALLRGF